MGNPPDLIIFDFDGTLFDTHQSISHCMKLTFDALLPSTETAPSHTDIQRLIASGAGLQDTFKALQPAISEDVWTSASEDKWVTTYREFYASHGQPLIQPFAGAKELLTQLKELGIIISVISNKGVAAVVAALANNGLADLVDQNLIVGDTTPGASRKPDTASFTKVLLERLKQMEPVSSKLEAIENGVGVVVVGDTTADIKFAQNIKAKSVWCRYGYGNQVECDALQPDHTIDSLQEIKNLVAA